MKIQTPLADLLSCLAEQLSTQDSLSGRAASQALGFASTAPLQRSAQRVPQCEELTEVFSEPSTPVLALLSEAQNHLHWTESQAGSKPASVQRAIASVELVGPSGMVSYPECRVGLFLQRRHSHYPQHHHAADELYLVLSGIAEWSWGKMPAQQKHPGTFIHHRPWLAHAMTTFDKPLLTLWCWTGDIRFDQYKLLAKD